MSNSFFSLANLPALQKQVQLGSIGRTRLLGSQAGVLIKRAASEIGCDIDFRLFGGLKAFATSYLRDQFSIIPGGGPGGFDDAYEVVSKQSGSSGLFSSVEGARELGLTNALWRAFSNPNAGLIVRVSPSFEISIVSATEQALAPNHRQIQPITPTDYFGWAKEYAETDMVNEEQQAAQRLLSEHNAANFAHPWYVLISSSANRYHVRRWEQFRLAKIIEVFRTRLTETGCPAPKIDALIQLLTESRASKHAPAFMSATDPTWEEGARREYSTASQLFELGANSGQELDEIRRILHLVVDRMSVDQLKSIPIPAGVIFEVRSRFAL